MTREENESTRPSLTLSSLYRLLIRRDFPDYSYRVFPDAELRGLTLVPFWEAFFREAFPVDIDLSVFRQENGQNRNLSRLLNGSGSPRLMEKWFSTLVPRLDDVLILRNVEAWMRLLEGKHYAPQALAFRLQAFLRQIQSRGEWEELSALLSPALSSLAACPPRDQLSPPPLFLHGYLLSWLTLAALFLGRTNQTALTHLWISRDLSAPALYSAYLRQKEHPLPQVITTRACILCASPLLVHGKAAGADEGSGAWPAVLYSSGIPGPAGGCFLRLIQPVPAGGRPGRADAADEPAALSPISSFFGFSVLFRQIAITGVPARSDFFNLPFLYHFPQYPFNGGNTDLGKPSRQLRL